MSQEQPQHIRKVIFASSLGTLIEWYDFYIFGMLAKTISRQFFPEGNETAALLSTLAIFAAGFLVRPFGAIVFGRLGDLIGRKSTFLLTLVLMGGATFLIGWVPGYKSIGITAPLLVLLLRLVQGLALGGEYGGAATYVAEHAPENRRGYYTAWIQTTATLGLFVALGVIMLVKKSMPEEAFTAEWGGWRYPFWLSIFLIGISAYIRLSMHESPLFSQLKREGKVSANPIKESFGRRENFRMVLLALFGAVMGQGVIWYTGQFYAQSFLENTVKLEFVHNRSILLWAITLATPFFLVFGALSDRIGRKWIMLTGMLLGVVLYRPIFNTLLQDADVKNWPQQGFAQTIRSTQNRVIGEDSVRETVSAHTHLDGRSFIQTVTETLQHEMGPSQALKAEKIIYSDKVLDDSTQRKFIFLVWLMIVMVTMVYGPIAAFLVELFPIQIRYTSMSLPYHIGNGVFGGLVPFIATLLSSTFEEDPLAGLWYPIGVAAICFLIGAVYLPESKKSVVEKTRLKSSSEK